MLRRRIAFTEKRDMLGDIVVVGERVLEALRLGRVVVDWVVKMLLWPVQSSVVEYMPEAWQG